MGNERPNTPQNSDILPYTPEAPETNATDRAQRAGVDVARLNGRIAQELLDATKSYLRVLEAARGMGLGTFTSASGDTYTVREDGMVTVEYRDAATLEQKTVIIFQDGRVSANLDPLRKAHVLADAKTALSAAAKAKAKKTGSADFKPADVLTYSAPEADAGRQGREWFRLAYNGATVSYDGALYSVVDTPQGRMLQGPSGVVAQADIDFSRLAMAPQGYRTPMPEPERKGGFFGNLVKRFTTGSAPSAPSSRVRRDRIAGSNPVVAAAMTDGFKASTASPADIQAVADSLGVKIDPRMKLDQQRRVLEQALKIRKS